MMKKKNLSTNYGKVKVRSGRYEQQQKGSYNNYTESKNTKSGTSCLVSERTNYNKGEDSVSGSGSGNGNGNGGGSYSNSANTYMNAHTNGNSSSAHKSNDITNYQTNNFKHGKNNQTHDFDNNNPKFRNNNNNNAHVHASKKVYEYKETLKNGSSGKYIYNSSSGSLEHLNRVRSYSIPSKESMDSNRKTSDNGSSGDEGEEEEEEEEENTKEKEEVEDEDDEDKLAEIRSGGRNKTMDGIERNESDKDSAYDRSGPGKGSAKNKKKKEKEKDKEKEKKKKELAVTLPFEEEVENEDACSSVEVKLLREKICFKMLKGIDIYITEILVKSCFVTVYKMKEEALKWVRADIEGFLYIVKRSIKPVHRLIITNKRNENHLVQDLDTSINLTTDKNYIFYRTGNVEGTSKIIYGLWFYSDEEKKKIYSVLKELTTAAFVATQQEKHNTNTNVLMAHTNVNGSEHLLSAKEIKEKITAMGKENNTYGKNGNVHFNKGNNGSINNNCINFDNVNNMIVGNNNSINGNSNKENSMNINNWTLSHSVEEDSMRHSPSHAHSHHQQQPPHHMYSNPNAQVGINNIGNVMKANTVMDMELYKKQSEGAQPYNNNIGLKNVPSGDNSSNLMKKGKGLNCYNFVKVKNAGNMQNSELENSPLGISGSNVHGNVNMNEFESNKHVSMNTEKCPNENFMNSFHLVTNNMCNMESSFYNSVIGSSVNMGTSLGGGNINVLTKKNNAYNKVMELNNVYFNNSTADTASAQNSKEYNDKVGKNLLYLIKGISQGETENEKKKKATVDNFGEDDESHFGKNRNSNNDTNNNTSSINICNITSSTASNNISNNNGSAGNNTNHSSINNNTNCNNSSSNNNSSNNNSSNNNNNNEGKYFHGELNGKNGGEAIMSLLGLNKNKEVRDGKEEKKMKQKSMNNSSTNNNISVVGSNNFAKSDKENYLNNQDSTKHNKYANNYKNIKYENNDDFVMHNKSEIKMKEKIKNGNTSEKSKIGNNNNSNNNILGNGVGIGSTTGTGTIPTPAPVPVPVVPMSVPVNGFSTMGNEKEKEHKGIPIPLLNMFRCDAGKMNNVCNEFYNMLHQDTTKDTYLPYSSPCHQSHQQPHPHYVGSNYITEEDLMHAHNNTESSSDTINNHNIHNHHNNNANGTNDILKYCNNDSYKVLLKMQNKMDGDEKKRNRVKLEDDVTVVRNSNVNMNVPFFKEPVSDEILFDHNEYYTKDGSNSRMNSMEHISRNSSEIENNMGRENRLNNINKNKNISITVNQNTIHKIIKDTLQSDEFVDLLWQKITRNLQYP